MSLHVSYHHILSYYDILVFATYQLALGGSHSPRLHQIAIGVCLCLPRHRPITALDLSCNTQFCAAPMSAIVGWLSNDNSFVLPQPRPSNLPGVGVGDGIGALGLGFEPHCSARVPRRDFQPLLCRCHRPPAGRCQERHFRRYHFSQSCLEFNILVHWCHPARPLWREPKGSTRALMTTDDDDPSNPATG